MTEDIPMDGHIGASPDQRYLMTSHNATKLNDNPDDAPIQFKTYWSTPSTPGPIRQVQGSRQNGTPFSAASLGLHHSQTRMTTPATGRADKSPQDPFRRKVFTWLEKYYNEFGVADRNTAFHKPDIVGLQKPSALREYIALVDATVRNGAARLRRTQQYDDRVRFYKALRHLYRYITGTEFSSQIDDDGDWIMGYLRVTYPYHP